MLTHGRADPHYVTRNPFPSAIREQRAATASCEAIPATEGNAESLKKKKKKKKQGFYLAHVLVVFFAMLLRNVVW